jgi:hypothetical protein
VLGAHGKGAPVARAFAVTGDFFRAVPLHPGRPHAAAHPSLHQQTTGIMEKLNLDLDSLTVTSFSPSDTAAADGGTVEGQAACPTEFEEHCDDTLIKAAGSMDEIQCCTTPQECFSDGVFCYFEA